MPWDRFGNEWVSWAALVTVAAALLVEFLLIARGVIPFHGPDEDSWRFWQ